MASWTLVDVPDSASAYVGKVLEDSERLAETNLQKASDRINEVADKATAIIVEQIANAVA